LVEEKTRTSNRIEKVLEDANIKLGSVASEVLGVSGRSMIQALLQGEKDPTQIADLAQRQYGGKSPNSKSPGRKPDRASSFHAATVMEKG